MILEKEVTVDLPEWLDDVGFEHRECHLIFEPIQTTLDLEAWLAWYCMLIGSLVLGRCPR